MNKKKPQVQPTIIEELDAKMKRRANMDGLIMAFAFIALAALCVYIFCLVVQHFDHPPAMRQPPTNNL